MKCNSCGAEIPEGVAFCGSCGAQVPSQPQPESQPEPQVSFCSNCGAELTPGTAFCGSCGAATGEMLSNTDAQSEGIGLGAQNLPPVSPELKPKKKKKALKIILIIVAVLAVICAILFAFKNKIIKAAVGETNYYVYAEYNTFKEFFSDDEFDALLKVDEININADGKIKIDGDETYTADFKGAYSSKKEQGTSSVSFKAYGEKVGPIKVNYGNDRISVDVKDLMEKAVTISTESETVDYSSAIQLGKDIIPIIKTCEKNLKKTDNMTVSSESIDGKKCRVVTITLTEKAAMNLVADFLEAVKEDESIQEDAETFIKDNEDFINTIMESEGTDADELLDMMDEGLDEIDDLIDDIRDEADDADDKKTIFEYKVAYSGSATIYQREIKVGDSKIKITTDISSKENVLKVEVKGDGYGDINVELKIEKSGKTRNASFVYSQKDSYRSVNFKIDANELKIDKVNGIAVPVGKIQFDITTEWDEDKDTTSGTIEMTAEDKFKVSLKIKENGRELASGSIDAELSNKPDFSDYEEPDEDTDSIEDLFEAFGGNSSSSYDDDYYDDYDEDYYSDYEDDYYDDGSYDYY